MMLKKLIAYARQKNASDVHLAYGYKPMIRVNGKLDYLDSKFVDFKRVESVAETMASYGEKHSSEMNIALGTILDADKQRNLEEKGELDFAWEDIDIGRCRINVYKENGQYALAVRLIKQTPPNCQELGLSVVVQNLVKHKYGLVLITGPTGSGKSTTLAALVQKLNEEENLHILTLEDPIEYRFEQGKSMINQREIGRDTKSFASGLRSALREDPDVILVGELRDAEALEVALQAAETGHLVLSTLHTRDAVTTINRIIDMLPQQKEQLRAQLADSLLGIVSQNLLVRKDGKGRVAALEILLNNNAVANLIREGRTHQIYSYLETSGNLGMQTMNKAINKLKKEGIV